MKIVKITVILLFFPFVSWGQKQLTGLWVGSLSNDSTTTRKEQSFEIALTEYRGKVYGYSRSEFIVNDTLYYILKRVKGTIEGDSCEVKDDEILSYNFRGRLDKGVKVTSIFRMNRQDSTWHLDGSWKTNKTKKFYSISGIVTLKEEKDLSQSKIFPHLEEIKLADDVAFYKEDKKQQDLLVKSKQDNSKTELLSSWVAGNKIPGNITRREIEIKKDDLAKDISQLSKTGQVPDSVQLAPRNKENPVAINRSDVKETNPQKEVRLAKPGVPEIVKTGPAAFVSERKFALSSPVNFKSDSLELFLYDNGEIDGDTVSVLLNNTILLAKEGLKTVAIKKQFMSHPKWAIPFSLYSTQKTWENIHPIPGYW